MNISELMINVNNILPELISSYCFINGSVLPLDLIDNMGYDEFSLRSKLNMPKKLYRYFPNTEVPLEDGSKINYSLIALKYNTVYMQSPSNFDDVYDSDINIDFDVFQKYRLLEYCKRCGSDIDENLPIQEIGNKLVNLIYNSYKEYKNFDHFFIVEPQSEMERLYNLNFQLSLKLESLKDNDIGKSIGRVIVKEYEKFVQGIKNTFRVACFATSPLSQLMWGGAYANCHSGFCVEYTILPEEEQYHDIYYNLFPMIYCKTRPDISKYLATRVDNGFDKDALWKIYSQGVLRKSMDWIFQGEWRLLLPMKNNNQEDYNVKFFPITKVYLGNRMDVKHRQEIIGICKENSVPYVGVRRNPVLYEMEECTMNCEDCYKFKQ